MAGLLNPVGTVIKHSSQENGLSLLPFDGSMPQLSKKGIDRFI